MAIHNFPPAVNEVIVGGPEDSLASDSGFVFDPVNRTLKIDGTAVVGGGVTPATTTSSGFTNADLVIANTSGQLVSDTAHQVDGSGNLVSADGKNFIVGTTTGSQLATAAAQKLAFHGATAVVQRAGAAQAAVVTTASTSTTPFGYSQAQADAIVTLLNEIRAALVEKGIIKGAA